MQAEIADRARLTVADAGRVAFDAAAQPSNADSVRESESSVRVSRPSRLSESLVRVARPSRCPRSMCESLVHVFLSESPARVAIPSRVSGPMIEITSPSRLFESLVRVVGPGACVRVASPSRGVAGRPRPEVGRWEQLNG